MSKLSLAMLESTIRNGDVATLSKCPGIGKKTAERLVVELKNKVGGSGGATIQPAGATAAAGEPGGDSRHRDAVLALTALGYKAAAADEAIRRAALALGATATTEALIKKALN